MKHRHLLFLLTLLLLYACVPFDFSNSSVQKIADLQGVQGQSYQGTEP